MLSGSVNLLHRCVSAKAAVVPGGSDGWGQVLAELTAAASGMPRLSTVIVKVWSVCKGVQKANRAVYWLSQAATVICCCC